VQDFLNISTGKRKYDEISSGYYIPQRDGATDGATDDELCTSMGDASNIKVRALLCLPLQPRNAAKL